MDDLYRKFSDLHDALDAEDHGDDCVLRCLRNGCDADHGCDVCADEDADMDELYGDDRGD